VCGVCVCVVCVSVCVCLLGCVSDGSQIIAVLYVITLVTMAEIDFSFDELSVALSYALLCGDCGAAKGQQQAKAGDNKKADNKKAAAPAKKADDFDDMFGGEDEEEAPKAAAPAAKGDDMDNMFEADDEDLTAEEAEAAKARKGRMEAARKLKEEKDAKEGKVKKDKVKAVEKSLLVLEVKPWEADTDLKMVWEKIREYQQTGLTWGQTFKLEPVAFGIMKLVMTATIVDSEVLVDDITENIEALEQWVQSVEVASMNKIS
jgi:elongation factor 1-beta